MARSKTGAERLSEWLRTHATQTELARTLQVAPPTVSRWATGALRPDPVYRTLLERVTGIEADAWLTDDERRLLRTVARGAA